MFVCHWRKVGVTALREAGHKRGRGGECPFRNEIEGCCWANYFGHWMGPPRGMGERDLSNKATGDITYRSLGGLAQIMSAERERRVAQMLSKEREVA